MISPRKIIPIASSRCVCASRKMSNRVFGYDRSGTPPARVTLMCPDNVRIEVEHFHDPLLTYEDDDLARLFGLFAA